MSTRYTIFFLLKAMPAWLALPRTERARVSESAFASAFAGASTRLRHYDA